MSLNLHKFNFEIFEHEIIVKFFNKLLFIVHYLQFKI